MPDHLNQREQAVYEAFWRFTLEHGYQPCLLDLAIEFGIAFSTVKADLIAVERKGWVRRVESGKRCVQLLYAPDGERFTGLVPAPAEERYELVKTSWGALPVGACPD